MIDAQQLNGAALAYLGDAIYELSIRSHVLSLGYTNPNTLHRASVKFVEASSQAAVMLSWISTDDYLTEEEIQYYKRGRNHKTNTKAKNASIQDYRQATGFEALLGWLYLTDQAERLNQLIADAIHHIEQNHLSEGGKDSCRKK